MEKLVRIKSQGTLQKQDWKSVTLTGLMTLGRERSGCRSKGTATST